VNVRQVQFVASAVSARAQPRKLGERPESSDEQSIGPMRGAAADPRCPHRLGLATIILVGLSSSGFAASQAQAGQASPPQFAAETTTSSSTAGVTALTPVPDPIPSPRPDPRPARPKPQPRATAPQPPPPQPPPSPPPPPAPPPPPPAPPPPPPAPTRAVQPRWSPPKTPASSRPVPARTVRPKVVVPKKPAPSGATAARVRPRANSVRKVLRERHRVRARTPAARKRSRPVAAPPAVVTRDLQALPPPGVVRSEPKVPTAVPVLLPVVGVGLLLLLGASAASFLRVPLPALAEPLYARRSDLAAIGFGAIALALLLLNLTVIF
jgi:hypothetical protein